VIVEHGADDLAAVSGEHTAGDLVVGRPAELAVAVDVHVGEWIALAHEALVEEVYVAVGRAHDEGAAVVRMVVHREEGGRSAARAKVQQQTAAVFGGQARAAASAVRLRDDVLVGCWITIVVVIIITTTSATTTVFVDTFECRVTVVDAQVEETHGAVGTAGGEHIRHARVDGETQNLAGVVAIHGAEALLQVIVADVGVVRAAQQLAVALVGQELRPKDVRAVALQTDQRTTLFDVPHLYGAVIRTTHQEFTARIKVDRVHTALM